MTETANIPALVLKRHLTIEEQLERLQSRGLLIEDWDYASQVISRLGYYRLSGYFYPLRKTKPVGEMGRQDAFVPSASFELVAALADFDKGLRLIALDAIETIEVATRVALAYRLGKVDPEAHLRPELLDRKFTDVSRSSTARRPAISPYNEWLQRYEKAKSKSKDDFVKHHVNNYQGRMPIWVAIELWDFGMLSRFFSGMQQRDQNAVAHSFGPLEGRVLASWLRNFNFVRNVAAHHSRLWNRTNSDLLRIPSLESCRLLEPLHSPNVPVEKLFTSLTCMRLLLKWVDPKSTWHDKVKTHAKTFPKSELLALDAAGFVEGWEDTPIWR